MNWFFKKKVGKKEFDDLKKTVQTGFNNVKQDINNTSTWIDYLNNQENKTKEEILAINAGLSNINNEIENLKNIVSIIGETPIFKQRQTVFNKQTLFKGVLNSVQTGVQTTLLRNLSTTERAIIFILLNSDIKLSYEDLSALLGKSKNTIRGQINSIKQKSEGLLQEIIGSNNKKRVYIPEKIKKAMMNDIKTGKKRKSEG